MAGHPVRVHRESLEAWSNREQKVPWPVVNPEVFPDAESGEVMEV